MKIFFITHKYVLLLVAVFILSEIIVNPLGNFPLNDDWSYFKSVNILQNEGKYNIVDWGAMTLFTHLIWGFLFTKIFGFSFVVLRFSTIVSSLIGILVLNKLVVSILFYISVFGTKDYLSINSKRWQAYNDLRKEKNTPTERINGGFEINCWN